MGISEILATLQTSCGEIKNAPCISVAQIALVPQKIRSAFSPEYIQNVVQGEVLTSLPSSITSIGNYAFYTYTKLALTSLPSGVTSIGTYAFYGCPNLALTSLPSSITSIGAHAFRGCSSLALTSLPSGITSIDTYAFQGCSSLTLTSLPSGITSIGAYAFHNCTNLALTSLPSSITSIFAYAFYSCTSLTTLTFLGTPSGTISPTVFSWCTNLLTINVPWASGVKANAPWGATNATINYNYTP